jgi:hypothetical protein
MLRSVSEALATAFLAASAMLSVELPTTSTTLYVLSGTIAPWFADRSADVAIDEGLRYRGYCTAASSQAALGRSGRVRGMQ